MSERIVCIIIGYICGLFQTSYFYGKAKGIDIREHGSGNAGTTNALRIMGAKAGALTLLGDALKCILAVFLSRVLYGNSHQDMIRLLGIYAAAGSILGHNFPFYLRFRGGKGIACTAGLLLSFDWRLALVAYVVFLINLFITHYVSLGSILMYLVFVGGSIIMGQMGMWNLSTAHLLEMYFVEILLMVLAVYKHRANIIRLLQGCENKTYLWKKKQ